MNAQADTKINEDKQPVEDFANIDAKSPPSGLIAFFKKIVGYYPWSGPIPLEEEDTTDPITVDDLPLPKRSFMAYVPFKNYDSEFEQMVTKNGERGVFFNVLPADVEGLSEEFVNTISHKIKIALDSLPGENNPWIVQFYQKDEDARSLIHRIKSYSSQHGEPNEYDKAWLKHLEEHISTISRREGIFEDKKGLEWRARYRRVRMVIYRQKKMKPGAMNATILRLTTALAEAGIPTSRMSGKDAWHWLMPWYSGEQENAYEFMETVGYPDDDSDLNIGEYCLRNRSIKCDRENKLWHIGNRYNRFITLEPYKGKPKTGHWVLEDSENNMTPFDRMPDGSTLMYTLVIEPQDKVEAHIGIVEARAVGKGAEAGRTKRECKQAYEEMADGYRMITFFSGIYIDAKSIDELDTRTATAIAAANGAGFDVLEVSGDNPDQLVLNSYLTGLPMNFDPYMDKAKLKRGRTSLDSHLAKLLPLYTRGRGTENYGINFNSAAGEPVSFDPLGKDRSENAHMFMIGNSGTGKTTTLITMLMYIMAVHNPRLYLITALPTFYLLGDYFKKHGKTVHRVQITDSYLPSLPPFADITKSITEQDATESRDYIGEAEYSARLMITQGNSKEEELFRPHDQALVKQALEFAAETVVKENRDQALTEDVVKAFNTLSKDKERYTSEAEREKLSTFGTTMNMYTTGMEGQLFNRPGEAWPEVDVTIVEFGLLARTGNEAKLAISLAGLMQMINHIVEKNQRTSRDTICLIDEGKVFLKNELTGPILNSIVSMWRGFGAWLWLATQTLSQVPDSSIELITQCEWWFGICLKESEVNKIVERGFKPLSPLQSTLLKKTRKEPDMYSEAGILSNNLNTTVRIVPPPITMALAETEKKEKTHRTKLMNEHGITELEAVYMRADEIATERRAYQG